MNVSFLKDGAKTRIYNRRMDSFVMNINGPYIIWAMFAICNNQRGFLWSYEPFLPWSIRGRQTHAPTIGVYHSRAYRLQNRQRHMQWGPTNRDWSMSKGCSKKEEIIYGKAYPGQTAGPCITQIIRLMGHIHKTEPNHRTYSLPIQGFGRCIFSNTFEVRYISCLLWGILPAWQYPRYALSSGSHQRDFGGLGVVEAQAEYMQQEPWYRSI